MPVDDVLLEAEEKMEHAEQLRKNRETSSLGNALAKRDYKASADALTHMCNQWKPISEGIQQQLIGDKVTPGNFDLLFHYITTYFNHLHSIPQCWIY